jgi:hypothetical protein
MTAKRVFPQPDKPSEFSRGVARVAPASLISCRCRGDEALRQIMKHLIFNLLAVAALAAAPAKQTFTGIVTDDNCPKADHSRMQMGPTDAECAKACIDSHGAMYGLYDGKNFYTLSDQRTAEKFVAKKVKVTGTLDDKTKTIHTDSITAKK